ncbi:MAG: PAS domain-containing sensor histidine kinase [Rubrivivax sp.]
MKRPGQSGLLLGIAVLALAALLALAMVWDRLSVDPTGWPGAAERAGIRARQQVQAEQAAEAWSRVLEKGLTCGGGMAVVWAGFRMPNPGANGDFSVVAEKIRPLASTCRESLPSLVEVWMLPASGESGTAEAVSVDAPESRLAPLPALTRARLREAAESQRDAYAVAQGDGTGIDQIVPVRKTDGALLLLRYRPDAAGADGSSLPQVLGEQDNEQGIPIRQAHGLRVAVGDDLAQRKGLASLLLVLMLLGLATVAWNAHQLRRHRQELQSTVEASPVGMRVIDMHGRITAVNHAFCDLVGVERVDLVGMPPPYRFWPERAHEERKIHLNDILAGKMSGEGYRVEFVRPDGSLRVAQVRATALHGSTSWLLSSEDITDSEQRQQQIESLHAELQEQGTSQFIGELAMHLTHELRTEITTIAQLALNLKYAAGDALSAPMEVELRAIREQTDQVHREINDFTQHVKGDMALETCDLRRIVDEAFMLRTQQAGMLNARLVNEVDPALPLLRLPRLSVLHVLLNLIDNALQWMVETPLVKRHVTVNDVVDGQRLHLTVEDRGSGIASDRWEQMFEKGWTDRNDGRGLGLWMCRRSLRRMDGEISVIRSSRQGTVMRIDLPYQPDQEKPHAGA